MAYGLPALGEANWKGKLDASIEAVKATADTAQATADAAQTAVGLDAAVAAKVEDSGSSTAAALVASYGPVWAPEPSGGDDTTALQAALLTAQSTTGTLYLHAGTYKVTTLATNQSFQQPRVVGRGIDRTTIEITANSGKIRLRGGAAGVSGGGVENLTIAASGGVTGAIGIELAAACFVRVDRVKFDSSLAVGVLFHNDTASDFTEHNILRECQFTTTTGTAVEWRVTAGNESFHGSGLRDCQVTMNGTTAPFKIGAGAHVYNAPLDLALHFTDATGAAPFDTSAATKRVLTHGNIRLEGPSVVRNLHNGLTVNWDHAGTVTGLTVNYVILNPSGAYFALVSAASHNPDGSAARAVVRQKARFSLTTGGNNTLGMDSSEGSLVSVRLEGPNYDYEFLLHVACYPGSSSGSAVTLSNGRAFDSAGYGAPTFSVSGNSLVITNAAWPASGVIATIDRLDLRTRDAAL